VSAADRRELRVCRFGLLVATVLHAIALVLLVHPRVTASLPPPSTNYATSVIDAPIESTVVTLAPRS
jgi:hypothetical protein